MKKNDGVETEETVNARWLIGADGGRGNKAFQEVCTKIDNGGV